MQSFKLGKDNPNLWEPFKQGNNPSPSTKPLMAIHKPGWIIKSPSFVEVPKQKPTVSVLNQIRNKEYIKPDWLKAREISNTSGWPLVAIRPKA